ncbi:MAG: DUF481 domain-containing protein [Acidobacteria bacterium]|nr:DUF481 domain-containing protein [Acidobacteriota bacterium]
MLRSNFFAPRNFSLLLAAIFFFLLFFSTPSFADDPPAQPAVKSIVILHLSNGDRVSGQLIATSEEQIEIENVYAGRVTVRLSEIKGWQTADAEIRTRLTAVIKVKDSDTLEREALEAKENSRIVDAKVATNPKAKQENKPAKPDPWKRQVNFAYTMTRGNVKSSDANLAFNVSRKKGTRKIALSSYGRSGVRDGQQSASLISSIFRAEQTVLKLPVFAESQFEIDKLKKLDFRFSENIGISYPVLKGDSRQLSFDFGTGFTKEDYETGLQKLNATSLLRLTASQKIAPRTILNQQASFFSDLTDPSAYRIQAEASLTTPLTKNLALRLAGINRFDARPQGQVKPNDFTLLTGFTFDF